MEEVNRQIFELGLLFLTMGILARFASVIRLSPVPFFLLLGLLFGKGGISPIDINENLVKVAAEIGAILLLLFLGLEYSATTLVRTVSRTWMVGLLDLVVNALPGVLLSLLLGWGLLGAVALGGVSAVSSSGIISQELRDLGWRKNRETPSVVSILVVEDLAMAPYLPLLTAVATGAGLLGGMISVGIALVVVTVVFGVALFRSYSTSRWIDATKPSSFLLMVFGLAIMVAGLAGMFDFSSAVAAFLVGLLLSGDIAEAARARLAPLRDLFAALFFLFFGFITDPAEIPAVLPAAIALTIATVGTKFITAAALGRRGGFSRAAVARAGSLLSARGEFSVLIAGIAATSLVAPSNLQPLVATYVMLTAIVGPALSRLAPKEHVRLTV